MLKIFNCLFRNHSKKLKTKLAFMKQKLTILLSFMVLATASFAQNNKAANTKTRFVGMHLNAMDVNTPQVWKDKSGPKTLAGLREQDLGFSLSFWQTIASQVDFSAKATIMFHDYSAVDRKSYSSNYNQVGIELEPTVNVSAFKATSMYNAFVTTGLGFGSYSKKFGAYVPAGLGLSATFSNSTRLLVQSQYRFSCTANTLNNNIFYSIGITQKM